MSRFRVALIAGLVGLAGLVWAGGTPERRYANTACQHFLMQQDPRDMGLVTIGGSRMLTATDSDHLNEILDRTGIDHLPAFNMAHSHFTLAKEYVVIRDLLEQGWRPRSILVMIEPRRGRYGAIHPEFAEIARLSDIPLSILAIWPEDPWAAIAGAGQILRHHLLAWQRIKLPKNAKVRTNLSNCHLGDYRLTVDHLARREELTERVRRRGPLQWDISGSEDSFTRTYIAALNDLAETYDTQVMFLHLNRAGKSSPPPEFADAFHAATGARLLIPPSDLMAEMDRIGRRDLTHINAHGRETFLPWLISEVQARCENPEGCL
jgi:hypothetical protein